MEVVSVLVRILHCLSHKSFALRYMNPRDSDRSWYPANAPNAKLLRDFDIRSCSPERPFEAQNWGVNVYSEQYLKLTIRTKRSEGTKSQ